MSAPALTISPTVSGWPLWMRQTSSILRTELRKNFITARGFWIYLLALAPAAIVWMHSIDAVLRGTRHGLSNDTQVMAGIFQIFFLRPAVYFGCVGIFTYLFRGEMIERSLHYYFLAPVRREVLIAGKYLAGLITAVFFFCGSIALTFFGMYYHYGAQERDFFFISAGYGHLFAYVTITALACMAYGALFLFLGIRYKNPVIPAVTLLFWESLNLFLPAWLRKVSILYYLRSMNPVDIPNLKGPGALLGAVVEPVSGWVAVPCLLAITAVLLVLAARQLRRTEISYSSD
jgi:ABC-type transport system involved in multi-copper enzyme maturation permease subunit